MRNDITQGVRCRIGGASETPPPTEVQVLGPIGSVPARKRFRTEIDAETMRKHSAGMRYLIRGVGEFRSGRHRAHARNPKPLVLAAFFGYFLSLWTESAPPEAFVEQRAWWERPLSHGFAVPAPLAQGSLFLGGRLPRPVCALASQ